MSLNVDGKNAKQVDKASIPARLAAVNLQSELADAFLEKTC